MSSDKQCKDALHNKTETQLHTRDGVEVFLLSNPYLHSFCISLYVRAGSIFETERESGITHLCEHLVFRSVNRAMGGKLYKELDRLGLSLEGCTYKEMVRFTVSGAKEHFKEGADILLRILAPLTLTAEDVRLEKGRVKAEIREGGEESTLDYFTDRILFADSPLARTITGTVGNVSRIGVNELRRYHRSMLSAKNIFFYVTGAVTDGEAEAFARAVDGYALDTETPRRENLAPLSPGFFRRGGVFIKNSRRHVVRLSIDVDTASVSDATLTLLYDILFGDGEACRLHQALSETTGFIYSFRAGMELYKNVGVISVSYEIAPAHLYTSVQIMLDVLRSAKESVKDVLSCVRAPYTDNAYLIFDSDADLNFNRAYEKQFLGIPHRTVEERRASYAAVTDEDITALARDLFVPSHMTLTLKAPERRVDLSRLSAMLADMK